MTPAEMLPLLEKWQDIILAAETDIEHVLPPLGLTPESPLYTIPWNLMDAYTEAVSALVGDQDEWLAWYWADNEMGAKKREATVNGKFRKIRNLRDLARVIVETRE